MKGGVVLGLFQIVHTERQRQRDSLKIIAHFHILPKPHNIHTVPLFADVGVRRRPAERPGHRQHPGGRRQRQHAHVWRGVVQRGSLHRHAAGGDGAAGDQSSLSTSSSSSSLQLSIPPFYSPPPPLCFYAQHVSEPPLPWALCITSRLTGKPQEEFPPHLHPPAPSHSLLICGHHGLLLFFLHSCVGCARGPVGGKMMSHDLG